MERYGACVPMCVSKSTRHLHHNIMMQSLCTAVLLESGTSIQLTCSCSSETLGLLSSANLRVHYGSWNIFHLSAEYYLYCITQRLAKHFVITSFYFAQCAIPVNRMKHEKRSLLSI
ncbi:islet cell autoantigen 1-like protein [Platysternon megacephalum]|uniref:Islet cell autoantigen 1-like protein n=1 Tax=Platysternon megacephalum TaxID=55544 RepID=A0A4D9F839_9SAUR|nr:islet cell autoantigen 1-like protein [Platysternon megacephalum]